jgi:hypothetical protein
MQLRVQSAQEHHDREDRLNTKQRQERGRSESILSASLPSSFSGEKEKETKMQLSALHMGGEALCYGSGVDTQ